MSSKTIICPNPEATFELGESVGKCLVGGEIILLKGPLGAGKTLFTKGLLGGLGFDVAEVSSPSFTLVNRYEARLTVYHADLWRLEDPDGAAFSIGIDELLEDPGAVIVIEWAERLEGFDFGRDTVSVEIKGDGDAPRSVEIFNASTGSGF
ncbi:MAG: tRNA (adenosine(37)-N6)-threonylcarbamoyltransferase complex ATPase subunit type 1 TsaE [Acidobacteria bacterium]|nr:MAG: tRNA (adenosine(37)-N6)-threonylcarbamoyltransferase complex ATPase subunit type 1 TsaE [Acidobacteriota bacterium]REK02245.1 MAG: tRNA (adenosine(37)-N6)-threonylcarbamoyltransferase complex ATPase subunit type 1 TsaE [Acidobacteriota bacterium]REK13952.1 MAG: tRNA (adenosine(37)-N6)-threonylcarbamoyltransferase complex ATPase subunit type 1 TsaE [Acidobacteriota bacterium]REK41946.1 MAG: tRNA (adenosine(37)-N6)-threonylcarbamoyltransferase complex ATPase subunit type 1 TsaE [Acidobacte